MKLRINTKLRAALIAAFTAVGFTSFGTGTLAVATGTALIAGQQAQALTDLMTKDGAFTQTSTGHYTQTKDLTWEAIADEVYANVKSLDMGNYSITLKLSQGKTVNQKFDVISGSGTYSYTRNHNGTGNRNTVWIGSASDFTGTLSVVSTQSTNNIMFGLGTSTKTSAADFSKATVKAEHGVLALASNDVRVKELVTSTIDLRYTAGGVSQNAGTGNGVPMDEGTTQNKGSASDRGALTVGKLTMSGTTAGNYIDFILTGTGSTISASSFGAGDTITVGEGADVTFSNAITLTSTIKNSGTVTFNGATVTMNCGLADLAGTNNYSDGEDGYIVSANKYIVQGGTISGLTSVTIGSTAYNVNEEGAVQISNPDYTCYYLNSAGASVNVTNEKTAHSDLNHIVVNGANGVIQIGSEVSLSTLTVADAASVSLSGSGSLAVADMSLGNGAGLTIGAGTTLKVSSGETAKALMMGTNVTNNGIFEIAGNVTLDNGATTKMGGTLKVDSGVTLKLSQSKDNPTSIESFTSVELAGGNLWSNTTMRSINALSVTGDSQISFEDFPNAYTSNPTKFAGTTRIDSGKTLTIYTNYKSSIQIAGLAGAGTLKLTTANRSDNGENVTIGTLAGFTGNISLAPGNANNPVRVTASLGNADVSMGTLSLNGNSGAATDDKHTFFKLTGEHKLTLKGIDGTNGEVSLTVPTLTLDTDSDHSYTGSLAIGGALVKTGSGSQTISGYTMYKGIDVQAGTLVLNGTYDITNLEMDPGVTYTYQNEQGQVSPDSVGGFRATNGSKTVYTKGGSAIVTDSSATYTLGGKQVQLTDGKYNYVPEADLATLWVNGGTLSYDAYYAASGETPALTTAQVAADATLAIGTNAVGTLAFQTNNSTINLSGTGTVTAINGTGTLNLVEGAEVTYNIPGGGANFTTTGEGTLKSGGFTLTGGNVSLGSDAALTGDVRAHSGSLVIGGDTDIDGTLYLGESTGNTADIIVNQGGSMTVNAITASWGFRSLTVNGVLNVEGELKLSTGNQQYTINGSGTVNTNKLTLANVGNYHIDGTNGLTLAVGAGGIAKGGSSFTVKNLQVQATADWSTEQNTALDGTLTVDTNNHNVTISSVLSNASGATGSVTKTGAGTLVLSGTNTYSGGTTVNGGTLKAASAGALGSGDVTVNAGALELTTTTALTGALTINDGGTLVFAGADMLTAGSLAVNGTVTFDLTNVAAIKAGTITLATSTGEAPAALSGVTVNWTLPESFSHSDVYVKDNSWVIDLISTGQALTWAGGTANWSYAEEDDNWLTPGDEPAATHFTEKDTAVFSAVGNPAVANIKEDLHTAGVEVQAGADVTLQAAIGAETASLTVAELEIAGSLATSVDVAATAVEATGADASWDITAGTVTVDSITVAEEGKLALSGTGMTVKTVSGPGTVEVGNGFTLSLSQQIDSAQPTDLAILNNGTVAVALGNSQNVINMDAASTGNLHVKAGHISYLSELGNQTLVMDNGTQLWFGDNAGTQDAPVFDNNIVLNGDVTLRVYGNSKHSSVTISGDVSGAGYTLTKEDGNQVLAFTGNVTLGGLSTTNNGGGTIQFAGGEGSVGNIVTNGATTIRFSAKEGAANEYTFTTFDMAPGSSENQRWLIVDSGVTVHGTGNSVGDSSTIHSGWGVNNGGLEVNGVLTTDAVIGLEANNQTAYIKGSGIINTAGLNFCNGSHTYIQGGITINITSDRGIFARNSAAAAGDVHLKDATLQAIDADWEFKVGRAEDPVTLEDTTTGTAFAAAKDRTITISKVLGGEGKLVKKGEGTVLAKGANTYSGGTAINAGTLATTNETALGTGNVDIAAAGTLEMRSNLTIAGDLTGTGSISYTGNEAGTLSLTKAADQNLYVNIAATGAGKLNLSLAHADYNLYGTQSVNNIVHDTNMTLKVRETGNVTATGKVLTGRLVVGELETETGALFTLSGEDAMLVTSGDATAHTYGNRVQGYGTFKLAGGATQTLTGDLKADIGFHGTFWADGEGSVLTIDTANIYGDQVTFKATNGGKVVLTSVADVKEITVDSGTFDLNADVETLNVSGDTNTLNIGTGSVKNINLGGNLTANGDLTIYSGTEGTKVTADAGKTLAVNGTANVDGRVQFTAAEDATVDVTNTGDNQAEYSLENGQMNVKAEAMKVIDPDNDVTVSNTLEVDEIVNDKGHTLTLSNAETLELKSMLIGEGSTVELLYTDQEAQKEGTVTITETLEAGGGTLLANLTIIGSTDENGVATTTLDLDGAGEKALTLGSTLTMNTDDGLIALDIDTLGALEALGLGETLTLVKAYDQTTLTYGADGQESYDGMWFDAMFSRMANFTGDYLVVADGAAFGLKKVSNVPEPTTGTLSLLALAALAARRRRK